MTLWKGGAGAGRSEVLVVEIKPKLHALVCDVGRGAHLRSTLG